MKDAQIWIQLILQNLAIEKKINERRNMNKEQVRAWETKLQVNKCQLLHQFEIEKKDSLDN